MLALCLGGLIFNAVTLGPALKFTARGVTDFMDLYAGGKLAHSAALYEPARVMETEARTEGWSSPTRLFMRLPVFALAFRPLAHLPYTTASAIWELFCVGGLVAFVLLLEGREREYATVACCWSLPLWMTVAEGQDIGFLLVWIAAAGALVKRREPVLAGVVASLCLAKFQLFLLVPVWIVARRRWRFGMGLMAGSSALIGASFLVNGLDWPVRYLALLREPANNPYREIMPNLQTMLAGLPHSSAFSAAAALGSAVAVWAISRQRAAQWGFAAALAASLLIAPHDYMADCALLIPAVLPLVARVGRAHRMQGASVAIGIFVLTPIPWLLLMTGIGLPARMAIAALVLSVYRWRFHAPYSAPRAGIEALARH